MQHLVLTLVLLANPLQTYERDVAATGPLRWQGWSETHRGVVQRDLPRIVKRLEARLGRRFQAPFQTVLTPDVAGLRRYVQWSTGRPFDATHVLGVAIPSDRTLVVRGGLPPFAEPFQETLTHEVAHLLIHEGHSRHVPRWLDEGVASWVSQPQLATRQHAYLSFLARTGGLYPLRELDFRFPGGHDATTVAYQQSLLFIQFLVERHGETVIPQLLDAAAAGDDSSTMLQRITGTSLEETEDRFHSWVARGQPLLLTILAVLNLWTLCALMAIVAILRNRRVRKRKLAAMAAEESESEEDAREEGEDEFDAWPDAEEALPPRRDTLS